MYIPDQVPVLHRRASAWYERNGLIAEAVSHAFAAEDTRRVARLVEESAFIWILEPSIVSWIVSGFVILCWLASEFVLVPNKVIPPLDHPPALPARDVLLPDETQVLGIVLDGQAHTWPVGILITHHIINESIRDRPEAAACYAACRSGYVFDLIVDGRRLTFEPVSVRRRFMILRDRETGTIWQHETGEDLMGQYRGRMLKTLGGELSNWKAWRTEHPETTVCSRPKGYRHPSPLGPIFERLLDNVPEHLVSPGLLGIDRRLKQHAFVAGITIEFFKPQIVWMMRDHLVQQRSKEWAA